MGLVEDAVSCIRAKLCSPAVQVAIITGSGWDLSGLPGNVTEINYRDIPGFPTPAVGGHKGNLVYGLHNGIGILLLQGRVHYYEGYGMEEVTFSVKMLSALGVKHVVITNAAGGINTDFKPGDFMLVTDHINMMGVNPLRRQINPLTLRERDRSVLREVEGVMAGLSDESRSQDCFIDMTDAYDRQLAGIALNAAKKHGIMLHTGVLAAVSGPSYETPAEVRMLSVLGADAVCMSTVPEVIMCRYYGMRVLIISMITNHAAGISTTALRHEDVVKMAESRSKDASILISAIIDNMPG